MSLIHTGYQPFDDRALCAVNKYAHMHSLCPLHVPESCHLYDSTQDRPRIALSGRPAQFNAFMNIAWFIQPY